MLVELFQEMMMRSQWIRLSHLVKFNDAHPLSREHVKSQCSLAWCHACNVKCEGKRPDHPHAVRFDDDRKTPALELDEHGQVVKPAPCEPPGAMTLAGKRKRQKALD